MIRLIFAFAVIAARPLANPDVLEPSIQNEVDHALSLVPSRPTETNVAVLAVQREFMRLYATNGMNATERAISLVSTQKNGEWHWRGTNVTAAAVNLLVGGGRRSALRMRPARSASPTDGAGHRNSTTNCD